MSRMFLDLDDGTEGCQWVPRVFLDLVQGSEPASSSRLLKAAYAFYFLGKKCLVGIVCLVGSQKSVICGFAATRFHLDPTQ